MSAWDHPDTGIFLLVEIILVVVICIGCRYWHAAPYCGKCKYDNEYDEI